MTRTLAGNLIASLHHGGPGPTIRSSQAPAPDSTGDPMPTRRETIARPTAKKKPLGRPMHRARRITAMALPRVGDVLRGEPNLIQGAAYAAINAFRGAWGANNGDRVKRGERPIDIPGLIHYPKRAPQGPLGRKAKDTFVRSVKLDPSRVRDIRGWQGPLDVRDGGAFGEWPVPQRGGIDVAPPPRRPRPKAGPVKARKVSGKVR